MRSISPSLLSLCVVLLFTGCGAVPVVNDSPDPQLQREFESAVELMRQNETTQAKARLKQLIDRYPDLAGAHINMGIIQLTEEDPSAAEQSFNTALGINPGSLPAHNQLGIALRMLGRFQEAEQAYLGALKLEPDYLTAHRNLGILYDLYLARPEPALKHYTRCQALSDSPDQEIERWIIDLQRRIKSSK
ncbi:MAG: tetratricopeptide repeat protein [Candidatus Thiodiazotropha sp. (ex Dulcina madagascariensis)]|nr:tetratricopeptide repeat protein [Candidatus Thiodiazotropha sp. (ex Dulcina madagascariensis)]MCU7927669.1 tetratricopeptide repeat protein [Candidatus Thiodiazotropha sp. (ex Dulcina madagascariensis)]